MQDKTWVQHTDPKMKALSMHRKHFDSPPPKKARVRSSAGKVMLTVLGPADFLAKGTTITGAYFISLLQKIAKDNHTERHGLLTKGVHLLQDGALVHNSHVAQMEAWSCGYEILPYPPYSSNLTPSDFHLFPRMKSFLKGKHFQDDEMLISKVKSWLAAYRLLQPLFGTLSSS
ncbi:histone-lysine N-methyltransferase SETMAR-like isoform 1-T1 [Pholidichthys leucotaenia]